MAIEAKATLMNEIEHGLAELVTAADMPRIMATLADTLAHYDINVVELRAGVDDFMDAYLSALRVEGRSQKTIDRYAYIIRRMMAAVQTPTRSITVYHLRRYLADEKARGVADRTLEGNRQVFSAYFNWLQRERLIESNPTANLGTIKYARKQRDIYSDIDMERLKYACKTARDRAIICFLRATGCRVSEMTQLNRSDVDLVSMECTVLGKGNKERTVFLDQIAVMTLQAYLAERSDDEPALFVGRGHQRMSPHGIRQMLVRLGYDAQVSHVHPHKFRRTTATSLIKHGMAIQEVAAILGHDKLDTTMQYVVLDKSDLKHAYSKHVA